MNFETFVLKNNCDSYYSFKLSDDFLNNYIDKQPNWGPLGYVTAKRTYCRKVEGENRTEEWWEVLRRVVEGEFSIQKNHCINMGLHWDENKAIKSAEETFRLMWNFKFLPPGRGLWMMGTDHVMKYGSMALNNCAFVSTKDLIKDRSTAFTWAMDALMQGVGVGFDTKGHGKCFIYKPEVTKMKLVIDDSRGGWVYALKSLLESYRGYGTLNPEFDFSKVRKAGEPIRGFGGVASGPAPLKEMLENIRKLLDSRIGGYLSSLDILDIFNYIAKCVVAGNVRRSAQIAIGQPYDQQFITSKQDMNALKDRRWASNNSIIAKPGMNYEGIAEMIGVNGEPGIIYLDNMRKYGRMGEGNWLDKNALGVNPCGEMTLEHMEMCNLVETFPSNHDSYEEYQNTLRYAYLYAKSVTLINTGYPQTNSVMLSNRRIGISQTGIIDAFVKHGRNEILAWSNRGYEFLKQLDKKYSHEFFCVNPSIKITTVKPSGTVSLLAGVSSGIHYPHSQFYIRRIRFAKNSKLLPKLEEAGYNIFGDPYAKTEDGFRTYCVDFPIKEEYFDRGKEDVSMWEQAANAIDYQKYWADNQVSITITFKPEERKDIKYLLETVEDKVKGLTMLPLMDHNYEAAPYESITEKQYIEMIKNIKPLDLKQTNEKAIGESGCKTDVCELKYEVATIGMDKSN